MIRTLLLDIETSPNIATVWGLWQQNIAINQILESGEVICWAAKWLDAKEAFFDSIHDSSKREMIQNVHALIEEADAVIHYNGRKFDMPHLNREFLLLGLNPPAPYKNIDLLETVKSKFRFASNKLEYVARELGIGEKVKHAGHELWLKCMTGDSEAWATMQQYNIHDVDLTEQLYKKILPWIKGHPNKSTFHNEHVCPTCGSADLQRRGQSITVTSKFQRWQCNSCGAWSRSRKGEPKSDNLLTSV